MATWAHREEDLGLQVSVFQESPAALRWQVPPEACLLIMWHRISYISTMRKWSLWKMHPDSLQSPESVLCAAIRLTKKKSEVTQSCPTLCDPMDCSLPGSSVHRILRARILEGVSHALLQEIFPTQESNWCLLHCRRVLYQLSYLGSPNFSYIIFNIKSALATL